MEKFLKEYIEKQSGGEFDDEWTYFEYQEDINGDALTDEWLENETSYIHKVSVLCAIDRNKCDWVHVAIGTRRSEDSTPEAKGYFYFNEGENDDIRRVINRAINLLEIIHPVFEN
jgi:hypothetical protein